MRSDSPPTGDEQTRSISNKWVASGGRNSSTGGRRRPARSRRNASAAAREASRADILPPAMTTERPREDRRATAPVREQIDPGRSTDDAACARRRRAGSAEAVAAAAADRRQRRRGGAHAGSADAGSRRRRRRSGVRPRWRTGSTLDVDRGEDAVLASATAFASATTLRPAHCGGRLTR